MDFDIDDDLIDDACALYNERIAAGAREHERLPPDMELYTDEDFDSGNKQGRQTSARTSAVSAGNDEPMYYLDQYSLESDAAGRQRDAPGKSLNLNEVREVHNLPTSGVD
jgi:hypothetical protein